MADNDDVDMELLLTREKRMVSSRSSWPKMLLIQFDGCDGLQSTHPMLTVLRFVGLCVWVVFYEKGESESEGSQ